MRKRHQLLFISLLLTFSTMFLPLDAKARVNFTPPPDDPPTTGIEFWDFNTSEIVSWDYDAYANGTKIESDRLFYNITSMVYEYNHKLLDSFYTVKLTKLYYNDTEQTVKPLPNYPLLNVSLVNFTNTEMYNDDNDTLWANLFIPHNGTTGLHLHFCGKALMNTVYSVLPMTTPQFEIRNGNEIYINDKDGISSSYAKLVYYSNGTLEYGEIYMDLTGSNQGTLKFIYIRNYDMIPRPEVCSCSQPDDDNDNKHNITNNSDYLILYIILILIVSLFLLLLGSIFLKIKNK